MIDLPDTPPIFLQFDPPPLTQYFLKYNQIFIILKNKIKIQSIEITFTK